MQPKLVTLDSNGSEYLFTVDQAAPLIHYAMPMKITEATKLVKEGEGFRKGAAIFEKDNPFIKFLIAHDLIDNAMKSESFNEAEKMFALYEKKDLVICDEDMLLCAIKYYIASGPCYICEAQKRGIVCSPTDFKYGYKPTIHFCAKHGGEPIYPDHGTECYQHDMSKAEIRHCHVHLIPSVIVKWHKNILINSSVDYFFRHMDSMHSINSQRSSKDPMIWVPDEFTVLHVIKNICLHSKTIIKDKLLNLLVLYMIEAKFRILFSFLSKQSTCLDFLCSDEFNSWFLSSDFYVFCFSFIMKYGFCPNAKISQKGNFSLTGLGFECVYSSHMNINPKSKTSVYLDGLKKSVFSMNIKFGDSTDLSSKEVNEFYSRYKNDILSINLFDDDIKKTLESIKLLPVSDGEMKNDVERRRLKTAFLPAPELRLALLVTDKSKLPSKNHKGNKYKEKKLKEIERKKHVNELRISFGEKKRVDFGEKKVYHYDKDDQSKYRKQQKDDVRSEKDEKKKKRDLFFKKKKERAESKNDDDILVTDDVDKSVSNVGGEVVLDIGNEVEPDDLQAVTSSKPEDVFDILTELGVNVTPSKRRTNKKKK